MTEGVRWDQLPLARGTVDRAAELRTRPGLVDGLRTDPATVAVVVQGGRLATERGSDGLGEVALELVTPAELGSTHGQWIFLGRDGERAYLAFLADDGVASPARQWSHLREVGERLGPRDAGLAASAVALAAWHDSHARCSRCGDPSEPAHAGWLRTCTGCGHQQHPRTDPAVIMAVVDARDRLLLGHAAHWPERRFSTLAGFVEAGEAAEQAVRREVAEEVSVRIGGVEYRGSQAWPFPGSLMLAFRAEALTSGLAVDGVELTDALWFTREELAGAVGAGEVLLPMRASIARALIEDWHGAPLP